MVIPSTVAIKTEKLKPAILRETILAQPAIEIAASTNLAAVFSTIVMHMVNGQNISLRLSTADAHPTVGSDSFLAKYRVPELHRGFLLRLQEQVLLPIMVVAKKLEAARKAVLTKPHVETMAITNLKAMISTVIVDVVNSKKLWTSFVAYCALAAICSKDLIPKLIAPLLLISMATSAEMTNGSRTSKALTTHANLPFLERTFSITLILVSTDLRLLAGGFSKKSFTLFPNDLLTMGKIVIMAARFARNAKFTLASTLSMPVLGGFRKVSMTAWAMFVGDCLIWHAFTKIKHALNNVLG